MKFQEKIAKLRELSKSEPVVIIETKKGPDGKQMLRIKGIEVRIEADK